MAERGSGTRLIDAIEELVSELPGRVRGGRERFSEQAASAVRSLAEEVNLVTREDYEELELRVAQLEHRLRLLEDQRDLPPPAA